MKNLLYILLWVPVFFSCSKELNKLPLDAPSSVTFPETAAEMEAALIGCFSPLNLRFGENPYAIWFEMYSDIAANRDNTPNSFWGSPTAGNVNTIWSTFYIVISRCNYLLDNMGRVTGATPQRLQEVSATARFLRAYAYSTLTELYGDVPLVTQTLSLADAYIKRDPKAKVVDFILSELDMAGEGLPQNNQPNTMVVARVAAWSLASRVALYNGLWAKAIEESRKVMALEGQQVELNSRYENITLRAGKTSKEIIWAIQFNYNDIYQETPLSYRSRLAGGFCNRIPVQALVDAYECTDGLPIDQSPLYNPKKPFENRDPRLGKTIALPGSVYYGYQFETHKDSLQCWNFNVSPAVRIANLDATHTFASFSGYCWRKYADPAEQHASRSDINPIVIRYAEVLLNFVEAKIESDQLDDEVYTAINKIRSRAGMPSITNGKSKTQLRSVVRKERKVELAGEGLRYFDILRWKIADKVLNGPCYGRNPRGYLSAAPQIDENGTPDYSGLMDRSLLRVIQTRTFVNSANYRWPIPDIEIQTNKNLVQNEGY